MTQRAIISLRPHESAEDCWRMIAQRHDYHFYHTPIISTHKRYINISMLADFSEVIISSQNVLRFHGQILAQLPHKPVFHVVGRRTAQQLQSLGCRIGHVELNAERLLQSLQKDTHHQMLFLSGQDVHLDFSDQKHLQHTSRVVCYETQNNQKIPTDWEKLWRQPDNVILLTSANIARLFSTHMHQLETNNIHAACMSPTIADHLTLSTASTLISKTPEIVALQKIVDSFLEKRLASFHNVTSSHRSPPQRGPHG